MVRWYIALAGALALLVPGVALAGAPDAIATVTEGHTAFVVLEITRLDPAPVSGILSCKVSLFGLTIGGDDASRCREHHVFATPSTYPAPTSGLDLRPTGRERTHVDDYGVARTTRELTYPLLDGTLATTYVTEAGATLSDEGGDGYNFVIALPPPPVDAAWTSLSVTAGSLG